MATVTSARIGDPSVTARSGQDFVFVTASGAEKDEDEETRRTIRIHVMRDFIDSGSKRTGHVAKKSRETRPGRQMKFKLKATGLEPAGKSKRSKGVLRNDESSSGPDHGLAGLAGRRLVDLKATGDVELPMSQYHHTPDAWIIHSPQPDPFHCLPVRLDPEDGLLLKRFLTSASGSWCPVNGQNAWFSYASKDPLLLYATMYNWIGHRLTADRVAADISLFDSVQKATYYKDMAIALINERLSQVQQMLTDETVAAVALMANIEINYGLRQNAYIHMEGLKKMIGLRGGLCVFGNAIGGLFLSLLSWTELSYTESFGGFLPFEGLNDHSPLARQEDITRFRKPDLHLTIELSWPCLDQAVGKAFESIRSMRDTIDTVPTSRLQQGERLQRSNLLYSVERQLRIISIDLQNQGDIISYPCIIAGLLYAHLNLRGSPVSYRAFGALATDLHYSLLQFDNLLFAWTFAPELLTWVLAVGALASHKREERPWFMAQLTNACRGLDILTYDDFQESLRAIVWSDSGDIARFSGVWQKVEESML